MLTLKNPLSINQVNMRFSGTYSKVRERYKTVKVFIIIMRYYCIYAVFHVLCKNNARK